MGRPNLMELMEKTKRCKTVDDLKALMEAQGIWLNDAAAQTAFSAIERTRNSAPSALSDDALGDVTAGAQGLRLELNAAALTHDDAEQILLAMLERFIA